MEVHIFMIHGTMICVFQDQKMTLKIKNDIFMQSQKENGQWHTKRQIEEAKEERNSHWMMTFPSATNFKNAMKMNHIHNCPVTVDDINAAEDIFGKDILCQKEKPQGNHHSQ